jgi:hypothetical protein
MTDRPDDVVSLESRREATGAPFGRACCDCLHWFAGECRRFPPQFAAWPSDNQPLVIYLPAASWPLTRHDHWCGEWSSIQPAVAWDLRHRRVVR